MEQIKKGSVALPSRHLHRSGHLPNLIGVCSMLSTQSASGPKNFSSYRKVRTALQNYKKLLIYANRQHEIIVY